MYNYVYMCIYFIFWSCHNICDFIRLVEKARLRQQAVDRASGSVSTHIFSLQSILRKNFLDQISKASMHERDNLRQWRRVIQLNTHPRYIYVLIYMYLYIHVHLMFSKYRLMYEHIHVQLTVI